MKNKIGEIELKRSAYHEAGHAFAVLGSSCFCLKRITLRPKNKSAAGMNWYYPRKRIPGVPQELFDNRQFNDYMIIIRMGEFVEDIFLGENESPVIEINDDSITTYGGVLRLDLIDGEPVFSGDLWELYECVRSKPRDELPGIFERLNNACSKRLSTPGTKKCIESIAGTLIDKKTMSAKEAREIYNSTVLCGE
jgi:hypothetical protein